jgi:hypothetical protein
MEKKQRINDINDIIKKYPKIFLDYDGNPARVNWYCPNGWLHILDWLCACLQNNIDYITIYDENGEHHPPQINCSQVKEKYGELRFYSNGETDEQKGIIRFAEYLASRTCQECGSMIDIGQTERWVITMCRDCNKRIYYRSIPYFWEQLNTIHIKYIGFWKCFGLCISAFFKRLYRYIKYDLGFAKLQNGWKSYEEIKENNKR